MSTPESDRSNSKVSPSEMSSIFLTGLGMVILPFCKTVACSISHMFQVISIIGISTLAHCVNYELLNMLLGNNVLMGERIGTAQVLKNNRITVPKDVLELLQCSVGDTIGFYPTDEGILMRKAKIIDVPFGQK